MWSLKFFLNHQCIHVPLSHMRLCLSLSILPFNSMKVGDHFDMHLLVLTVYYILENEANTHLHFAVSSLGAGSTVVCMA